MARKKRAHNSRDAGGFVALPFSVLDSPAYARLGHPARSLLLEIARQYVRDNNGRLLASAAYLGKRGWNSSDVITRAKRELLAGGFIFETVMGHRPNKASWYAVTWHALDRHPNFDPGAERLFRQGAYRADVPLVQATATPARGAARHGTARPSDGAAKNRNLTPSGGAAPLSIAPSNGVATPPTTPSDGAMPAISPTRATPSHGDHLETPSPDGAALVGTAITAPRESFESEKHARHVA